MQDFSGARNIRGFSETISNGRLPDLTHLTYEGVFNETKFDVGKKTDKIADLHYGYARTQFMSSMVDKQINDYLAIFLKGSADGADRDQRPLNAIICLDISGSMNMPLNKNQKQSTSRLKLSVEAIKMLISKLRQNDSIGMITFGTETNTIFEPMFKKDIDSNIYNRLDKITCYGAQNLRLGFQTSKKLLQQFIHKHELKNGQNRIIMLTDVCDTSFEGEKNLIEATSVEVGVNLTVIGISSDFRSSSCQKLKNIKGFNYFCAINQQDLKKYVFQTFDFGFFVSAYDLNISISSEDIKKIEVFGTPDSDKVAPYNHNFTGLSTVFTISKMKSVFPSQLEIYQDKVLTIGGLILVKLKRKSQNPYFKGEISLSYSDAKGQFYEQKYNVEQNFHPTEQFYSEESLRVAIDGYLFTSELRFLINVSKDMKESQIYKNYWQNLKDLGSIVPQSKKNDYQNVKKIVQGFNK